MARAVGLDIGARSIKVVELGGSAKAPRIQRMAIREIPPPPTVEQVEQVEGEEAYDPDQIIVDRVTANAAGGSRVLRREQPLSRESLPHDNSE